MPKVRLAQDMTQFERNVKSLAAYQGYYTNNRIAEILRVSPATLRYHLINPRSTTLGELHKMSKVFHCSIDDLIKDVKIF